MTRTFQGLRWAAIGLAAVMMLLEIGAVAALVVSILDGTFAPAWLLLALLLVPLHLAVAFAWSVTLVREPGRTSNRVWGRTICTIADEDIVAFGRAENEIRIIAADGRECHVTTSLGVRADDVLACYADLIRERPELLAQAPKLQRLAQGLR
ncbi:MAG: hypothetical protein L0G99_04610 [Propionibacteriales bacterium]|nr:hypothetical protein [Propionibacteriales bacterium]